jgi:hypothetical protein
MLNLSPESHQQGVMFAFSNKEEENKNTDNTLYFIDPFSSGKKPCKGMICTIAKTLNIFGCLYIPIFFAFYFRLYAF